MGKKNFFGIKEAIKYFKVNRTDQDLKAFAKIPFSKSVLKKLKKTHILVAVFPLSIFDIRKMNAKLFYGCAWHNDESFDKEHGQASWQLVRKTPVPKSILKNWGKLYQLLAKNDDEVSTAQVMVYTIIGHYLATGECLFKDIFIRTSSLASDGASVHIGCFGSLGLYIHYYWHDYYENCSIGVSSARKF